MIIGAAALASLVTGSIALAEDAYVYSPNAKGNDSVSGAGVNTGYYMKPTSRIEVDFQYPTAPSGNILFGAWDDGAVLRTAFWNNGGKFQFMLGNGGFKSYTSGMTCDAARHTAILDAKNNCFKLLAADGTDEFSGSVSAGYECKTAAAWPIVLFGAAKNAAGESKQQVKAKIYSVKIYETENGTETLVHDFVPCMKGRDAGFYDERTGNFLYGCGPHDLVCGGDNVKTIPDDGYLQSNSSQYFNTGYYMNPSSRIEVSFQYPSAPSGNFLFGAWWGDDDHGLSAGCWNNGTPKMYSFICADGKYNKNAVNGEVQCSDTNRFTAVIDVASNICQLVRNGYVRYNRVNENTCDNAAAAAWPTVLFGAANSAAGDGKQGVSARIYSAKIYEREANGTYTLKKNFVPYEKDGNVGFIEKVSGVFTAISGIGSGGNLENDKCAYVENDGSTVLNLGYKANMKSRIEVDYQCLNPTVNKLVFGAWHNGTLRYCCWNNGGKLQFIFEGNGQSGHQSIPNPAVTSDTDRHTAVMDFKNIALAYITDGVTNSVPVNATARATFEDSTEDVATDPMGVFGGIIGDGDDVSMPSQSRIYSVRIYEDEELIHEFLPYTDGTSASLYDVKTGYVATKVKGTGVSVYGIGVDGEERWLVTPQDVSIDQSQTATLKAVVAGSVSRYTWKRNGEAVSGGSNGELEVSWRKTKMPDVYTVAPVYSFAGAEIEGAAVPVSVENLPLGLFITIK